MKKSHLILTSVNLPQFSNYKENKRSKIPNRHQSLNINYDDLFFLEFPGTSLQGEYQFSLLNIITATKAQIRYIYLVDNGLLMSAHLLKNAFNPISLYFNRFLLTVSDRVAFPD